MWYKTANSDDGKPLEIDETSSQDVIYVRRDFVFIEATEDNPAHWEYMETTIPKNK